VEVEVRKVLVLTARCRGAIGAGGLELARRTVVISVTGGRKGCSQSDFRYLSLLQRSEAVEEVRPHTEWPQSVVFTGVAMGVFF
jgi:hypothetical protein